MGRGTFSLSNCHKTKRQRLFTFLRGQNQHNVLMCLWITCIRAHKDNVHIKMTCSNMKLKNVHYVDFGLVRTTSRTRKMPLQNVIFIWHFQWKNCNLCNKFLSLLLTYAKRLFTECDSRTRI